MRTWPASNVASSFPPQGTQPVFATLRTCRVCMSPLTDAGERIQLEADQVHSPTRI